MEAALTAVEADDDHDLRVPCYCEENVWRLAHRMTHQEGNEQRHREYHVAFVSNPTKCVPMFQQLANSNPLEPVFWDYHVVLFETSKDGTKVLDIDSHLKYKIALKDYLKAVFPNWNEWTETYLPYFRVIEASSFLKSFASDRSHMINPETKEWNSPPPPYPCIQTEKCKNNISKFFSITEEESQSSAKNEGSDFGAVYSILQLVERYHV